MTLSLRPRRMLEDMPSFFSNFFDDEILGFDGFRTKNLPATNISDKDNHFLIEMAVPGMKKDDFHVTVENGILHISSEKKEEKEEKDKQYRRREYNYYSFERSFTLPESVKQDDIKARYKEGVLSLTVEKKETSKKLPKKEIPIQ